MLFYEFAFSITYNGVSTDVKFINLEIYGGKLIIKIIWQNIDLEEYYIVFVNWYIGQLMYCIAL